MEKFIIIVMVITCYILLMRKIRLSYQRRQIDIPKFRLKSTYIYFTYLAVLITFYIIFWENNLIWRFSGILIVLPSLILNHYSNRIHRN